MARLRKFLGLSLALVLIAVGYLLLGNPDVNFRSSDSNWADGEAIYKGRSFDRVLIYFEMYKLDCNAPDAELVRTTPVRWYNLYAWPSYLTDAKWNVRYGAANPKVGSYYEPKCMDGKSLGVAELKASKHLSRLKEGGA